MMLYEVRMAMLLFQMTKSMT